MTTGPVIFWTCQVPLYKAKTLPSRSEAMQPFGGGSRRALFGQRHCHGAERSRARESFLFDRQRQERHHQARGHRGRVDDVRQRQSPPRQRALERHTQGAARAKRDTPYFLRYLFTSPRTRPTTSGLRDFCRLSGHVDRSARYASLWYQGATTVLLRLSRI